MKKFETPELKVTVFDVEDVITIVLKTGEHFGDDLENTGGWA